MKTINDYPIQTVTPTDDDIMWIFTGRWNLIDNFAPTPVTVDVGRGEQAFPTSEHAYAAAKADSLNEYLSIASAVSPGLAKARGRECILRADWETVKFETMWKILQAKFDQNPDAVLVLRETRYQKIYEGNTWGDRIWGVTRGRGDTWVGRNALGAMLMELMELL